MEHTGKYLRVMNLWCKHRSSGDRTAAPGKRTNPQEKLSESTNAPAVAASDAYSVESSRDRNPQNADKLDTTVQLSKEHLSRETHHRAKTNQRYWYTDSLATLTDHLIVIETVKMKADVNELVLDNSHSWLHLSMAVTLKTFAVEP
ncbi:hypothetical protein TSAR_009909 [Trichomalopsis sarcophagae]|uniref:Uncharacterized protein n=1 Tax=Trichomalopsis sarcophagae TaxID=543379 RepID=A0A232FLQ8_9HYME|nr:hypothetical protein TSAR_009909 [Trichomalopsis sarcophagae]